MSENPLMQAFTEAVKSLTLAKDAIAQKAFKDMAKKYSEAILEAEIQAIEAATTTSLSRVAKAVAQLKQCLRDEKVRILTDYRGSVILYRDSYNQPLATPSRKRDLMRLRRIQALAAEIAGSTPPMVRIDFAYNFGEFSADDSTAHKAHQERMRLVH